MIKYICKFCGKNFWDHKSNYRKFCSRKCRSNSSKGKHPSSATEFKKGNPPPKTAFKKGEHPSISTEFKKGQTVGPKNTNWKGGRIKTTAGYIRILKPEHPFAMKNGYVFEHRLVMEKYLGRYLTPEEEIHHINGIPSDNRIENLKLFPNHSAHQKFHLK